MVDQVDNLALQGEKTMVGAPLTHYRAMCLFHFFFFYFPWSSSYPYFLGIFLSTLDCCTMLLLTLLTWCPLR